MNVPAVAPATLQPLVHSASSKDDLRWHAVLSRCATGVKSEHGLGEFFYGVVSTRVVCRPGCPSRTPARRNVFFFDTVSQALEAGFRVCLRCHPAGSSPMEQSAKRMKTIVRSIEARVGAGEPVRLGELAQMAGLSPFHLQRSFRAALGVSPAQYARQLRQQRFRVELEKKDPGTVTEAIYAAGFQSSGPAYTAGGQMGMTPSAFKLRGAGETIWYSIVDCPLGRMLVAATAQGVCSIGFADKDETLQGQLRERFASAKLLQDDGALQEDIRVVLAHLKEPVVAIRLPLQMRATAFQKRVWEALQSIPAGETRTYAEVARDLGKPTAARAVARACASNPIALAVPCHRVVGTGGALTGYRWGTKRKQELLANEQQATARKG